MSFAEASPMLDIAAECVIRLSAHLSANARNLLRVSGGVNAREQLWSVHHSRLHLSAESRVGNRRQFIVDVVRACFSDDDGLFDDVTEDDIEALVDQVLEQRALASSGDDAEESGAQHALLDAWQQLVPLVNTLQHERAAKNGKRGTRIQLLRRAESHVVRAYKALLDLNALDEDDDTGSEVDGDGSDGVSAGPFIREQNSDEPIIEDRDVKAAVRPDQVDESNQPDSVDESNTEPAAAAATSNTDDASSNVVVEEQTTGTDTSDASAAAAAATPQIEEPNQSPRADVKKARSEAAEATTDDATAAAMAVDDSATKEGQLKIKRVADDVEKIGVHVRNLHEIAESWHSTHGESEPETDERNIDALQRQTIAYSEALMRDLLTLDEIVGDELRPIRKHNVREVQSLLDDVDALRKRLVALHRDVKKRADAKRAERAAQEAEATAAAAAAAATAAKPAESSATPVVTDESEQAHTEEDPSSSDESGSGAPPALEQPIKPASESPGSVPWKSLRLEPEFHVNEADDGAIELIAYVPGLREKDIDIRLVDKGEQEQLEVAGLVLPTAAQAQQLWQSAVAMKHEDRRNGPHARFARTPVSALALRGGAGRFGTFQQRFALPRDAVSQDISASLQRGYLTVRIPRVIRRRAPVPQPRAARVPRGYQQPAQQQQQYYGMPPQQQQQQYGGRRGQPQQQSPLFWW